MVIIVCDKPSIPGEELTGVPEWSKGAVWYQIFPERFRNGEPGNDPKITDQEGCWPHDTSGPWEIHPWDSDWYEPQSWEMANGKDIWYNITRRRYGGDLQGIINKLDYLSDLGIDAIYLNPVFVSPSHHKYDITSYHHIEPTFGPDPTGDRQLMAREIPDDPSSWKWTSADKLMLELIREVHRRGMKIIFDGVFNHVGYKHFAFKDVLEKGKDSKFKDWFIIRSFADSATGTELDYEGWWGVKDMPELKEDENGIVQGPKKYLFDITRRWMDPDGDGDPSDGIDGWRLDVAFCVAHPFWKDWRKHVRSINPEAYLTAEVIDPPDKLKPYLEGDEFDAVMNYNFAFLASDFLINDSLGIDAGCLDTSLQQLREAFRPEVTLAMQNLLGSHDTHRAGSRVANDDVISFRNVPDFFDKTKAASNPEYLTRKPSPEEYELLKLMVLFQMTYPGAPMIYYGDEAGMWGAGDPCCRKPMVWDDIVFQDEAFLPDGNQRDRPDKVSVNHDLLDHYRKMIKLRKDHPVLKFGDYQTIYAVDDVFAFSRKDAVQEILVFLNKGKKEQNILTEYISEGVYKDLLNDKTPEIKPNREGIILPPASGRILLKISDADLKNQ
ncbi:MAG: glycoside hydrolase family 13 protein [Bacteroidetes bacterium]|nr:glycoside hydrolase family 13 protein [Bacteroidota bacterium]